MWPDYWLCLTGYNEAVSSRLLGWVAGAGMGRICGVW